MQIPEMKNDLLIPLATVERHRPFGISECTWHLSRPLAHHLLRSLVLPLVPPPWASLQTLWQPLCVNRGNGKLEDSSDFEQGGNMVSECLSPLGLL